MIIAVLNNKKSVEQRLLELTQEVLFDMQEDPDFSLDDYMLFSYVINDIQKIQEEALKPYLVRFNMNKWHYYQDYIIRALELIGYEYVGRMNSNEDRYKFEANDEDYDALFRYKDKNCDYTKICKFND